MRWKIFYNFLTKKHFYKILNQTIFTKLKGRPLKKVICVVIHYTLLVITIDIKCNYVIRHVAEVFHSIFFSLYGLWSLIFVYIIFFLAYHMKSGS